MSKFVNLEMVRQRGSICEMTLGEKGIVTSIYDRSINPLTIVHWGLTKESIFAKTEITERDGPYFESSLGSLAPKRLEEICGLKGLLIGCDDVALLRRVINWNLYYRCSPNIKDKFETIENLTIEEARRQSDIYMRLGQQHAIEPYKQKYRIKVLTKKVS